MKINDKKMEQTHWKKLVDSNYIGAHDLGDKEVTITLEKVGYEMIKTDRGEERCIVARIKGAQKGMVLNRTNCKIITAVLETPFIEQWAGKQIIIYATKVKAFGELVDAIRVKREKVTTKTK